MNASVTIDTVDDRERVFSTTLETKAGNPGSDSWGVREPGQYYVRFYGNESIIQTNVRTRGPTVGNYPEPEEATPPGRFTRGDPYPPTLYDENEMFSPFLPWERPDPDQIPAATEAAAAGYEGNHFGLNSTLAMTTWGLSEEENVLTVRDGAADFTYSGHPFAELRNRTVYVAFTSDLSFDEPQRYVSDWNGNTWPLFRWRFETNTSVSIHPQETNTTDGNYIEDAFVDIFRISSAIPVHTRGNETVYRVPVSGEVAGYGDFRAELPENTSIDRPSTNYTDRIINHSFNDIGFEELCLRADGDPVTCDGLSGTDHPLYGGRTVHPQTRTFEYGLSEHPESMSIRGVIAAELITVERVRDDVCMSVAQNDSSVSPSECWNTTTTIDIERVNVTDSRAVETRPVQANVTRAVYPNGQVDFRFNFSPVGGGSLPVLPWTTIDINGTTVNSGWQFVPWRDPSWDTLEVAGQNREIQPFATPLAMHAVPVSAPHGANGGQLNEVVHLYRNSTRESPNIPENVSINVAGGGNGTYNVTNNVIVRHTGPFREPYDTSQVNFSDITITRTPRLDISNSDEATVSIEETSQREIEPTAVHVNIIPGSGTMFRATAHVTNGSGERVHTIEPNRGEFYLAGERVQLRGLHAEREFSTRNVTTVEGRFEPADWWELNENQTAYVAGESTRFYAGEYGRARFFFFAIRVLSFPVAILYAGYAIWNRDPTLRQLL